MKKYLVALMVALASLAASAEQVTAGKIIDGDTFWVLRENGSTYKLRLKYADAPEICQEYGPESKKALEALIVGKKLEVKANGKSYDRMVGTAAVDGKDVATELIASGGAWLQKNGTPKASPLRALEKLAMDNKVGLWASSTAIDPADFRKKKRCYYGPGKKVK